MGNTEKKVKLEVQRTDGKGGSRMGSETKENRYREVSYSVQ